jgi:sodium/bile acid cotransporter 7
MHPVLRRNGFFLGLVGCVTLALIDPGGLASVLGTAVREMGGLEAAVFLVFVSSGMTLDAASAKQGMSDLRATAACFACMFIAAPLLALPAAFLPLPHGIVIGLYLTAVVPSTFTSSVVMCEKAGGNTAQALLMAVASNVMGVFSVPFTLGLMLPFAGEGGNIAIDQRAILIKLALIVLLPLCIGTAANVLSHGRTQKMKDFLSAGNQVLIVIVVTAAAGASRETLLNGPADALTSAVVAFLFHALLLCTVLFITRSLGIGPGRREGVIFVGSQKTLTLPMVLQAGVFPQYGAALVFTVAHHIVHLLMDAKLAAQLRAKGEEKE